MVVGASAGVAPSSAERATAADVVRDADAATYRAEASGRAATSFPAALPAPSSPAPEPITAR